MSANPEAKIPETKRFVAQTFGDDNHVIATEFPDHVYLYIEAISDDVEKLIETEFNPETSETICSSLANCLQRLVPGIEKCSFITRDTKLTPSKVRAFLVLVNDAIFQFQDGKKILVPRRSLITIKDPKLEVKIKGEGQDNYYGKPVNSYLEKKIYRKSECFQVPFNQINIFI